MGGTDAAEMPSDQTLDSINKKFLDQKQKYFSPRRWNFFSVFTFQEKFFNQKIETSNKKKNLLRHWIK